MKTISILVIAAVLASCNTKDKKANEPAAPVEQKKPDTLQQEAKKPSPAKCYMYADASDTINLTVIQLGEAVTGSLSYHLKEKDRNEGSIQGNMRGDTLVADYTFMSEGVWSTRQVAFKRTGNAFIEGYGNIYMKDGKEYFKNIASLKFTPKMKLTEFTCK